MIISASRRTDIPTYYSPWLLNRLRTGEVLVRNPFNRRQVSRLRLDPGLIDCLVLWTKNPAPLLPYLPLITELGYSLVVHFTITGCDHALEPGVPALDERIATFCALARILGPQRVLWRFDPIVLTQSQGPEDWLNRFSWLAAQLHGYTLQCAISFVSLYAKCRRHLAGVDLLLVDEAAKQALVLGLAEQARLHGMRLVACCDAFLIERCGVEQARCIDAAQLSAILGYHAPRVEKDPGQRSGCGCSRSVDIGAYECCGHGCRYCYATTNMRTVARNMSDHDPDSPLLIGHLRGDEIIRDREIRSQGRLPSRQLPLPTGQANRPDSKTPSTKT